MPTYKVMWQYGSNSAVDDVKDLARDLQEELYQRSREVLVEKPDPNLADDEQVIGSGPFMMRRAVSRQTMRDLESKPDGDPSTPRTIGYWFVYRVLNPTEAADAGARGFWVARVVEDLGLAWLLQKAQSS